MNTPPPEPPSIGAPPQVDPENTPENADDDGTPTYCTDCQFWVNGGDWWQHEMSARHKRNIADYYRRYPWLLRSEAISTPIPVRPTAMGDWLNTPKEQATETPASSSRERLTPTVLSTAAWLDPRTEKPLSDPAPTSKE